MIYSDKIDLESLDVPTLKRLMNNEVDLLSRGRGDEKLFCLCSDVLSRKEEASMTHERFVSAIDKAEKAADASAKATVNKKTTKRASFKKAALIAAAVLLVAASMTVLIAAAFGVDIFAYIKELSTKPAGTTIVVDNFTFQNTGEPKEYSSFDEMLKSEGIGNIIYPTKWPNDADITDVYVLDSGRNTTELLILTSDPSISMDVELGLSEEGADLQGELYVSHGITFHLYNNGMCYACCFYGGNYYDIQANNFDELRYIIDNLKM